MAINSINDLSEIEMLLQSKGLTNLESLMQQFFTENYVDWFFCDDDAAANCLAELKGLASKCGNVGAIAVYIKGLEQICKMLESDDVDGIERVCDGTLIDLVAELMTFVQAI